MSAWHIGAVTRTRRARIRTETGEFREAAPEVPSVDTLIRWIPGEAIAFYTAIVLALQSDPPAELTVTAFGWLAIGIAAAMVLTLLGGWAGPDKFDLSNTVELALRTLFAGVAFSIWSLVIPGSWWYSIETIAENREIVPIVAGLGGAAFSLFAEGFVRRAASWLESGSRKRADPAPPRSGPGLSRFGRAAP